MPYRRPYRKKKKGPPRRRYRRKRYNRGYQVSKSPMPKVFTTNLKYSEIIAITANATAGLAAAHVFSANGIYDPNITGVGHQPRGFDEIQALFNHNRVLGSKITIRCSWGNADIGCVAGIALMASNSVQTNMSDYTEYMKNVKRVFGTNDGLGAGTLTMKACPHKFLGLKYDEDNLRGSASGNPSEQAYWHIFLGALASAAASDLKVEVDIQYLCQFFEPKVLTES